MRQSGGPQLLDIHLPQAPSWWPPAPGWWLLGLVVLALLLGAGLLLRREIKQRARQRIFERELDALARIGTGSCEQAAACVAGISVLLRRIMVWHAPQAQALRDEDWLRFLDGDDPARPFSAGVGRILLDGPYRPRIPEADAEALLAVVRSKLSRWSRPSHA